MVPSEKPASTRLITDSLFKVGVLSSFTGTPLLKADKATAARFGGFIHTYSMRQAVEDEAVVPLLYDGRMVDLQVNHPVLDDWFERQYIFDTSVTPGPKLYAFSFPTFPSAGPPATKGGAGIYLIYYRTYLTSNGTAEEQE